MIKLAGSLGLVAEHKGDDHAVMQIKFYRPDEAAWYRTHVTWTTCYEGGKNAVAVYQITRTIDTSGLRCLRSWLRTIGREG